MAVRGHGGTRSWRYAVMAVRGHGGTRSWRYAVMAVRGHGGTRSWRYAVMAVRGHGGTRSWRYAVMAVRGHGGTRSWRYAVMAVRGHGGTRSWRYAVMAVRGHGGTRSWRYAVMAVRQAQTKAFSVPMLGKPCWVTLSSATQQGFRPAASLPGLTVWGDQVCVVRPMRRYARPAGRYRLQNPAPYLAKLAFSSSCTTFGSAPVFLTPSAHLVWIGSAALRHSEICSGVRV